MDSPSHALFLYGAEHVIQRLEEQGARRRAGRNGRGDSPRPQLVLRARDGNGLLHRRLRAGSLRIPRQQPVDVTTKHITNRALLILLCEPDALPGRADRIHFLRDEVTSLIEAARGTREHEPDEQGEQTIHGPIDDTDSRS